MKHEEARDAMVRGMRVKSKGIEYDHIHRIMWGITKNRSKYVSEVMLMDKNGRSVTIAKTEDVELA